MNLPARTVDDIRASISDGTPDSERLIRFDRRLLLESVDKLRTQLDAANELLALADAMLNAIPWLRAGDHDVSAADAYEAARVAHSHAQRKETK